MSKNTIEVLLSNERKEKPQDDTLQFGKVFTDHMFVMDYTEGIGWHDPQIIPYQPITLDPACMVFHYGQTVFEGLKAYRTKDGRIVLFRPEKNFERLNQSNDRMCIPQFDEELALEGLKRLIEIEKDWVPHSSGTSLYIRPFIIATEPFLGVSASDRYKFMIILSPVGAYYKGGINPVKITVENEYVRSVKGGTGTAKTGGNYSASLKAQEVAAKNGSSQVLWLDALEKKYVEEVGAMNIFFKINGEVVTPMLNGSILPGVTRNSIIELLKHWNIPVSERRVSIEEIFEAHENGKLEEVFGTGTAAVISPVGELSWGDREIVINENKTGELSLRLYDTLTGIQNGDIEDPFNWVQEVEMHTYA
ncbi:branched-chain amino acid aminotransferase [Bacillus sp. 1P06AnD]|uniref:branched-chain amino acid aminotransferase n=1 Tax=Bacillus sp. 1P06AnD TaxID=3132208 RepID=UPI0039A39D1F